MQQGESASVGDIPQDRQIDSAPVIKASQNQESPRKSMTSEAEIDAKIQEESAENLKETEETLRDVREDLAGIQDGVPKDDIPHTETSEPSISFDDIRGLRKKWGLTEHSRFENPPRINKEEMRQFIEVYVSEKRKHRAIENQKEDEKWKHSRREPGKTSKAERFITAKILSARGVKDADKIVEIIAKEGSLKRFLKQPVIDALKQLTPDQLEKGIERSYKVGSYFSTSYFSDDGFIDKFKSFADAPEELVDRIVGKLSTYTSLRVHSYTFDEFMDIVNKGGLSGEQIKKLDALEHLALLSEGPLRKSGYNESFFAGKGIRVTLSEALGDSVTIPELAYITDVVEFDMYSRMLKMGGQQRFNINQGKFNFEEDDLAADGRMIGNVATIVQRDHDTKLYDLLQKGAGGDILKGLHVTGDTSYRFSVDSAVDQISDYYNFVQRPENIAWSELLGEVKIRGSSPQIGDVMEYRKSLASFVELKDIIQILPPEDRESLEHYIHILPDGLKVTYNDYGYEAYRSFPGPKIDATRFFGSLHFSKRRLNEVADPSQKRLVEIASALADPLLWGRSSSTADSSFEKIKPLLLFIARNKDAADSVNRVMETAGDNYLEVLNEFAQYQVEAGEKPQKQHAEEMYFLLDYAHKYKDPQTYKEPALKRGYKMMGDYLTLSSYMQLRRVLDGSISDEELSGLGLTSRGEEGIVQLEGMMGDLMVKLTAGEADLSLFKNKFFSDFLKSYVRYNTSAWGNHSDENFNKTISEVTAARELGQTSTDFPSSGLVEITKIERSKDRNEFTESFLSRYGTITGNIRSALDLLDNPRSFSTFADNVKASLDNFVTTLKGDLDRNINNPKAQTHIQQRIAKFGSINPADLKSFQANFSTMAQEKTFHDLLMQAVFLYTLKKYPEQRDRMARALSSSPNVDSITAVLDFTQHMTTKEAWGSYFTDKNARRAFQNLLDVKEIEDGLSRLQGGVKSDVSLVEFVPTRDVLLEFSGYVADACWASKYNSTAAKFPNITAVMMQDVSREVPKLLGSSLLIETVSQDGTPLLIIRGLNPQESYINHLDIPDFYSKFTEYVKRLADGEGRRTAIVIDGHSGGAATNRPLLYSFLSEKRSTLKQTKVSPGDTTFNGYNISENTYLVE